MEPDWKKRVTGVGVTPTSCSLSLLLDSRCSAPSPWRFPQTHISSNLEPKLILPSSSCTCQVFVRRSHRTGGIAVPKTGAAVGADICRAVIWALPATCDGNGATCVRVQLLLLSWWLWGRRGFVTCESPGPLLPRL